MIVRTKDQIIKLLEECGFTLVKVSDRPLKFGKDYHTCDMFAATPGKPKKDNIVPIDSLTEEERFRILHDLPNEENL